MELVSGSGTGGSGTGGLGMELCSGIVDMLSLC